MTIRVSDLITAAQEHIARYGDTPVGIVVNGLGNDVLYIEDAVRTGQDKYDPDDGEWIFEIEADADE